MAHDLAALDQIEGYRNLFTDVDFWTPYVREVCRRHGLLPGDAIRTGIPGTCPTFMVDERWVVKFFGRLFDGGNSFVVEQEVGRLVRSADKPNTLGAARVLASGALGGPGWPWPYLVFEYIPGISIGEAAGQIPFEDRLCAAGDMGETARWLHGLALQDSSVFPNTHTAYRQFLEKQRAGVVERQREWGSLPPRLVEQIDGFIPELDSLVDTTRPPHLIHADLTRDHLLGRIENGRWTSLAVIDFGDAMTGDLLYELGSLHLDQFGGDRRLLAAFLEAYGLPAQARGALPRKALATALLHRFNLFSGIAEEILDTESLEELAGRLWSIEQ